MDSLGNIGITLLGILNIVQGQRYSPRCDESANEISYWKEKYERDYQENDGPAIRCDKAGGFCQGDGEKCAVDRKRWQTTCYDKCICCFDTGLWNGKQWTLMDKKETWEDAQEYCRKKRGELLVPENIWDVILFLRDEEMGKSDVWVGINDYYQGYFEGVHGNYISNGWQKEQPRLKADAQGNCVVVEDEPENPGLKVEPCYAKNYFICDLSDAAKSKGRYPIFLKKKKAIKKKTYHKWSSWEKHLHKPVSGKYGVNVKIVNMRLTWKKARAECQNRGGDLHIPPSVEDMVMYMREEGVGSRDIWIGYSDVYSAGKYEGIQSNKIVNGWQSGQPAGMHPGDDCIVVEDDTKDGIGMKVEPCEEKHMFICDASPDYRSNHDTKE